MPKRPIQLPPSMRYLAVQIVAALVTCSALPLLTRIYSPDVYGQYLLILSTVTFLSATATNWAQQSVLRFLPGHPEPQHELAQLASLTMVIGVAVAASTAIAVALLPGVPRSPTSLGLAALFGGGLAAGALQASIQQALERTQRFAAYLLAANLVPVIAAVLLSLWWPSLPVLLASQALGAVCALAVATGTRSLGRPAATLLRRYVAYGGPLAIWIVSAQFLNSIDRFMIAEYLGTDAAGVYATNYNIIVSIQSFLFGPILLAAHPTLMRLWNSDDHRFQRVLRDTVHLFLIAAALSLGMATAAHESIGQLLLGEQFRSGTALMPIISAGHILWGLAAYLNKGFEFRQQTWKMGLLAAIAAVSNIVLNIIWLPRFGVGAAAWSTLAAYGVYLAGTYLWGAAATRVAPSPTFLLLGGGVALVMIAAGQAVRQLGAAPPLVGIIVCGCAGLLPIIGTLAHARGRSVLHSLRRGAALSE